MRSVHRRAFSSVLRDKRDSAPGRGLAGRNDGAFSSIRGVWRKEGRRPRHSAVAVRQQLRRERNEERETRTTRWQESEGERGTDETDETDETDALT